MKRKRMMLPLILLVCVLVCACGEKEKEPEPASGEMLKIVVTCSENDPSVMYRVDFRTGQIEKTVFTEEPAKTERECGKQDELKQFIEERIVPTYGTDDEAESSAAEDDEQKILWNIKVTYENETLIFSSFSKYPAYWTELIGLLEESIQEE